ncbi:MAG TPA: redoxin domain-containing protein [Pirellulales bacterium]|nr:redoxin domain-containing protein [Pirellulales bacterium]
MTPFRLARVSIRLLAALAMFHGAARGDTITVLTPGGTAALKQAQVMDGDLWVTPEELKQAIRFELKPEGACCGGVCIPIDRSPAAGFVRQADGTTLFNLSKLARTLREPVVAETEQGVFSFGEVPAVRAADAASGAAPDFALPDRSGKIVHLSDSRGKKVFLVTWASWCGCKLDLAGWQTLYEELRDKNFHIIAVAEDTAGEAAAGEWYDKAKATYTTLIDRDHVVSSLYHMVNVPTGVWIDEQGQIVRPGEVAYSRDVALMSIKVNGSDYVAGLRDWVAHGAKSKYVLQPEQMREKLAGRSADETLADAHFKLATYFQEHDEPALADKHFKEAQQLNPDSWNYHRQQWSYTPKEALGNWLTKVRGLGDKPYYAPLALPAKD